MSNDRRSWTPAGSSVPDRGARSSRRALLITLAAFVGLAVAHTWPLATAPGTLSRNDTGDAILHEWIMAWVAHQVVSDPLHLFDANIFYPDRNTLAYSDHLFVPSMMVAPLLWAGASPVLAHNVALLAGLALTGWVTCLVVKRWTASWAAGMLSGSLVAFNSFTLTRLTQIQDLHLEFFPLLLGALDRLLARPSVRHALVAALWYVLQALTGTYLMVITAFAALAAAASRPRDWTGAFIRNGLLAGVVAGGLLLPFLLPYYFAQVEVGLGRPLEEVRQYSAEPTDYLAAAGRLHFGTWSRRYFEGDALFPGVTSLALAAIGLVTAVRRDRRARMVFAFGLVAFAMSFGPAFPPYRWLYLVFPPLSGIRGAVRFGQFVVVALGVLAGFGLATLQRRAQARWLRPLAAALLVAANAEAWVAPITYTPYRGIAPVYDVLPRLGRNAVLAWLPFPSSAQFHLNAPFMLVSTRTWQRMLNGYSGFKPPSYYRHAEALAQFPDRTSLAYLVGVGVTHVLVDGRNMRPERLALLDDFPQLHLWVTDGNLRVYLLTAS